MSVVMLPARSADNCSQCFTLSVVSSVYAQQPFATARGSTSDSNVCRTITAELLRLSGSGRRISSVLNMPRFMLLRTVTGVR